MQDKVRVSISEIENGYLFDRSWEEKKGDKTEFMSEQVFMKTLPAELKDLFKKGNMKKVEEDNKMEKDGKDPFEGI